MIKLMQTISYSSIIIGPRFRKTYPDIDQLAVSIARIGLIQPVVIDHNNNLIAGGRRMQAIAQLKWEAVPVTYVDTLNEIERKEMELEENLQRVDLPWQDNCLGILAIHRLRMTDAALNGTKWGYEQTGLLLGRAMSNVNYAVRIGERLEAGDKDILACSGFKDALTTLLSRKYDESLRELAARSTNITQSPLSATVDPLAPKGCRSEPETTTHEINLSANLLLGDCIKFMQAMPNESVDHIYTDPPYAINMKMLAQEGTGMVDIDRVAEEHEVDKNILLLDDFIKEAGRVLKPTGFCVLWYDMDLHKELQTMAKFAGFSVQRWPLVWTKTHICQNQAAAYNFTKCTEVAMVLRKTKAVLAQHQGRNYFGCGNDKQDYNVSHPFWKPLPLHLWILNAIALPGQTVLDPFAGCGSIPLACAQLGLSFTAIELVPEHYSIMRMVLEDYYTKTFPGGKIT